jgi:hypothetical protein
MSRFSMKKEQERSLCRITATFLTVPNVGEDQSQRKIWNIKEFYLNHFLEEGNFYRNNVNLLGIKDVETILILKSS